MVLTNDTDAMILTIDIGNSRIKWAAWQAGQIIARGADVYAGKNLTDISASVFERLFADKVFSDLGKPSQVYAVCVAAKDIGQALNKWFEKNWQLPVKYLKTHRHYKNIRHAYTDPSQHGVDRWAALIAGHEKFPASAICVVSAGTAITFDFVDKHGRHLGGYILPSYLTMHNALTTDTANVISGPELFNSAQQLNNKDRLPDNTNDAVNLGLHRLLQAGIRDICSTISDEPVQILITGGGAETVLSYPDMPVMQHEPDLVMQGLYEMMRLENNEKTDDSKR